MKNAVWQGRLPDRKIDNAFEILNSSIEIDSLLFEEELTATRAHAHALQKAGIYDDDELKNIITALDKIKVEIINDEIDFTEYEDIHSLVETKLTELAGKTGAKIQTARSRNEQTVTNQRLYLKKAAKNIVNNILQLQSSLISQAEANIDVVMPGFTHGQLAQPMRFSFYLCSLFYGFERDKNRMLDAYKRIDKSTAGSGALTGATFEIDREYLAEMMDFAEVSENALDSISDRDSYLEFLSVLSILMTRLSRMAEDLIVWSSRAYGFIEISDTYCTSSSLMPQKKNPDALELIRGKTGQIVSNMFSLMMTCKGLPCGYQKDLQEDKAPLFESISTVSLCLEVATGIIETLKIDAKKAKALILPECLATDLADVLVKKGIPFREAYKIVAEKVRNNEFEKEASENSLTPEHSVERRNSTGGTSYRAVKEQINNAKACLHAFRASPSK